MSMTRSTYSQKLTEALDTLRPAFREVGNDLQRLTRKRAEIAPTFLKTFTIWRRETGRSMLAFVHTLDPSVPVNDRAAYRVHPSYQAAFYLKGLAEGTGDEAKRRGATPLAMLAITIKSFMPLCGSQREQKEALQVILAATKWRDRDQRRLLTAIRRARPVGLPKVPRLIEAAKASKAVVVAFERERLETIAS